MPPIDPSDLRELALHPDEPIDPLAPPAAIPPTLPARLPPAATGPTGGPVAVRPAAPRPAGPRPAPGPSVGRTGMGWLGRRLVRSLVVLALAGAVGGGFILYHELRASPVQLLNGFDFPLEVTLTQGEQQEAVTVPPHGRVEESLSGRVTVRATTDSGDLLSTETVDVPRGYDLVVYNVLGAAAIYDEEIVYSAQASSSAAQPAPEALVGQTFVMRRHVAYVFQEPDDEINLSSSEDHVSRVHVGYIGDGSWSAGVNVLIGQGNQAAAARVLDAVLRVDPSNALARTYRSYLSTPRVPAEAMPQAPTPVVPVGRGRFGPSK